MLQYVPLATHGFPLWLRTTHWINALFLGFLIRSGIQILAALPKLYWRDDAIPKTEWIKFTTQGVPEERPWVSQEEQIAVSSWLGQPGGSNLGLGRYWHFFALLFWLLNGIVYLTLLFITGEWTRLLPVSWSVFPQAWQLLLSYLSLHPPVADTFHPYNPLQQMIYSGVVFVLCPFMILTGAAQSAAFEVRFPWYTKLFGGRQAARSLHFLGLLVVVLFTIMHTALVVSVGFPQTIGDIILGQHQSQQGLAIALGAGIITAIFLIYGLTSWYTRRFPRRIQYALRLLINPLRRVLFPPVTTSPPYTKSQISPFFRAAGFLPQNEHYQTLVQNHFQEWRLEVKGLVEQPLCLSLTELHNLPKQTQITRLHCIPLLSNQDAGGLPESDCFEKAPFRWEKKAVGMASQAASIAVSCHEE